MHNRYLRRRSKRKRDWKCIWTCSGWKNSKYKEGNRYPDTGGTKGPKEDEPNRPTPRHMVKMSKVKDKEEILKAAREKQKS